MTMSPNLLVPGGNARVKAILREPGESREGGKCPRRIVHGDLVLDLDQVAVFGAAIRWTDTP